MNNGPTYYYSSAFPLSDYSSVSWTRSETNPLSSADAKSYEELPEQEVQVDNLSNEMQQEMSQTPDNFEGMQQDEMGDYEGGNNNDNSSGDDVGGSDAGGSDAGSGDSGGGDAGGGDAGGGE